MSALNLSSGLNILKDLTICEYTKSDLSINRKCYIAQWNSKCHKISLYAQCHQISAIVQDVLGKVIVLSSKNIKIGVNGKISQNALFKMIKYDQSRMAITLHKNRNNHFTLWIIPKLEAAGRTDEILIKKAREYETQAQSYANLFREHYNQNNFNDVCTKYKQALNHYKRAYDVRKKNKEYTQEIETAISVIKKELFLFKLEQKMAYYLPNPKDQNEVKEIFDPFINEEDVFEFILKLVESKTEEQCSPAENFTRAYSSEFLGNYTIAIKSYLLLSRQHYENKDHSESINQMLSNFCLEKAASLFKETIQTSDSLSIANFLEEIGIDWLSKTIGNILGNNYFKILIEENRLKKIAYKFVKKTREESNKYTTYIQNEEIFKNVCKAYEDAIYHLQIAYRFIKKNKSNIQEIEADINKLQKELFEFKLPYVMDFYLSSIEDQNSFKKNLSLLESEENFSSLMFKLTENLPEEQGSLVDNFTCACVYESLNKPTRAAQHYLYMFQQYIDNLNLSVSVKCLKKAETLTQEKAEAFDRFAMVNFLQMLDRNHLEQILERLSNNDPNIEYVEKTLLKKDAIRIAFEECSHGFGRLSPKINKPTCFICFNVEERDVSKWLENTLVPDLDRIGIKPIFYLSDLGPGKELSVFQGLIRQSDLVIVVCTPLLKKKCDACLKNPIGVVQEIRLAIERYNDADKYETIYPIYLKGNRYSSCPSVFLEPIVGLEFSMLDKSTEFSVFNYYSNAFELFRVMLGIPRKKSREIKEQFLSKTKNIIFGNQVDEYKDKVDFWRKNRIDRNKILLKSISDNISTQTKVTDFPLPPHDFTGREKELNDLHEACKNNNTVAITGLGGIGKTSLALKYANEYKSHYKFVYFITASSKDNIVQGLIDLADKMSIPPGDISIRLKNLRNQLHGFDGNYLLIFDGIDHPKTFKELKTYLPNNSKCILLTSRMSEFATQKFHCKSLPLTVWRIEEATDYLIKTTKIEEAEQAKILAEKLGCLPLALTHASAYIRTRRYTICKYIKQFERYEVKLFEKEHIELEEEDGDETILTTWQITLNVIENYHKCSIAKPILAFFSFLSQTSVPLIVIEHWFKTFFCSHSDLELGNGLRLLYNYSMIDSPYPECYTVHLSVQNVIRYHLSFDERYTNLVQILSTLNYWLQYYSTDKPTLWPFIRIIVAHCEVLSSHIQKAKDTRIYYRRNTYIFYKSWHLFSTTRLFHKKPYLSKIL